MAAPSLRFRQVHLDFHTSEHIVSIGAQFDPHEFAATLARAHVDSVTCFSRCHHGWIYHDTRFPAKHPGLERNLLKEQIEACHARDIRVPIYITVGWDEKCAREHPEWLEMTPEGGIAGAPPLSPGWRRLCFNTAYVDYVVAQTEEVMQMFPVDGLFFDILHQGECCCPACLASMHEAGLDPSNPSHRRSFANGILRETKHRLYSTVRRYSSDCTIFFNAGHVGPDIRTDLEYYTHLELESLPSGGWGYDHFPATVRYARNLGLPTMAMTGRFHRSWGDFGGYKNQAALEFECFSALAEGSICSVGDQLHPSGKINAATYQLIGNVYSQVAAKEPWCSETQAVTEIAILTPEAVGTADGRVDTSLAGALHMLQEAHYQFDVVDTQSDLGSYKVLILPDKIPVDAELTTKIQAYLSSGGRLLMSHKAGTDPATGQFALQFGCRVLGEADHSPDYLVAKAGMSQAIWDTEHVMYERALAIETDQEVEVLAEQWRPYFNRTYKHFCSHGQTPPEAATGRPAVIRSGRIIYFAHPIFRMYRRYGAHTYKQLVLNALTQLLPERVVESSAPTTARLSLMRQTDRHILHILHYIPERRALETDIIEDIIPLYDVSLSVMLPSPPRRVYLAPGNEDIDWEWQAGRVRCRVPQVQGHQMVVFE